MLENPVPETARPGPRNALTDVAGISVGSSADPAVRSGVTVVRAEPSATAAVDTRGGAPGTRETDALDPSCLVERADAIVLSGGSVFGLDAAGVVTDWLAARGQGFRLGTAPPCPIVPAAIVFDLSNGGAKDWGETSPYRRLGREACDSLGPEVVLGNAGAGFGALAGAWKGGLGTASTLTEDGITAAALVVVNSFGSPVDPRTGMLWAEPFVYPGDIPEHAFHGRWRRAPIPPDPTTGTKASGPRTAGVHEPGTNTTIGVVACDAALGAAEARRVAIMAQDGLARALRPAHSPVDGDTLFVLATGRRALPEPRPLALARLGTHAGDAAARAIVRAVWEAKSIGEHRAYRPTEG